MPEIYSMSRWGPPDKYDGYKMPGDKYVHSIKHKRKKEHPLRGCPNNNRGAHMWVCNKFITHYTDNNRYRYKDVFESFSVFCLLCDRAKRGSWGKRPSVSVECLVTRVEIRGPWENGYWTSYKTFCYDGETDIDGKATTR